MRKRLSKRLVIDPSVLLAAGETEHPVSSACRRLLQAVLGICHQTVVTEEIEHEWQVRPKERGKRPSVFSQTWRATMQARKKLRRVAVEPDEELRARLQEAVLTERERQAIEEDLHLVEAALATDGIVFSLDDTVRGDLQTACARVRRLRRLIWVNPTDDPEQIEEWLRHGATPDRRKRLDAVPDLEDE